MLRRILASRGFISVGGVALVALVALAGGLMMLEPTQKRIAYCALMPDAVGLYLGNDVTLRGMKVGTVTGITNIDTGVRVDFGVDANHPLRWDVSATTVSDTLVAARHLAVIGGHGADWNPATCVNRTVTPKSLTRTLDSVAALADQLDGGGDPARRGRLGAAISEFDRASAGNGPKLHDMVTKLASAMRSPEEPIARIGSLIDTLSVLSQSIANGWGNLHETLSGLTPVLETVNGVWDQVVELVRSLVTILPWINDVTTKYGGSLLELLDNSVPYIDLISARVGTVQKLIQLVPTVTTAFRTVTDPRTGRVAVTYAAPRVALAPADAARVCAAVTALAPGRCTDGADGLAGVDLSSLVLGLAGMR